MAKRTRKEKVIAELRRQLDKQSESQTPRPHQTILYAPPTHQMSTAQTYSVSYLPSDIIKTLMLTSAIVGIELVLYLSGIAG